ncbi:MAG: MMPL family transporter [Roseburia sp.]|nr:MMPL family transporter [Roseburia sp.]
MQEKEQKAGGSFWFNVANFIVNKRKAILLLFVCAIIYSVYGSTLTQVNQDITKYLPSDSETRIGLTTMEEEFTTFGMASVMIANVTYEQAEEIVEILEKVEGVSSVTLDNTEDYYVGSNALLAITVDEIDGAPENIETMKRVKEALTGYDYYVSTTIGANEESLERIQNDMTTILILAVIIIVAVLTLATSSYMAVPVLMTTFGVAAILNMGTNHLLGEISSVTDSIAVVLQLAMAIDYAIILFDRFMEEKQHMDSESAIKVALSKAIPEISASSLTTISGMLALCFMQFKIGYDMGIVLIKAILLSMVSVFLFMPGLLMTFEKLIDKTLHKNLVPNVSFVGKFASKTKYIIPPIFLAVIIWGFITSNNCLYIYDMNNVESAKKTESKIATEKIEAVFGKSNQLVVLVPTGDYEKEAKVIEEIEELDYVTSVLGLANQEIMDGITLTEKITPREFSEIADLDMEIVQFLYTAYAYSEEQYGPMVTGIDEYSVPLLDMVLFLVEQYEEGYVTLSGDMAEMFDELKSMLDDATAQLKGENYVRFILNIEKPAEGEETYAAMEEIRGIAEKYYGKDTAILVGNSTSCKDLAASFAVDNVIITILTALFVLIILIFTFQSAGLPVLLVLTIQGSIWINFSIPALEGQGIYFIAYLICSAIQMGATIDYAIVISSRYMDLKYKMPLKEAIGETINQAFPTIFTSGSIMSSAGFLIGNISSDPTTSAMGIALGRGTVISIILVVLVLPQILLLGDVIIEKTALNINFERERKASEGKMFVSGHVTGYVQGEIDADVQGIITGDMELSVKSIIPGRDATVKPANDIHKIEQKEENGDEK